MVDIVDMVEINAPPERVYQALTTAEGVRGWWTRQAVLDGAVGGAGEFRFSGHARPTRVRIEALEPSAWVGWRVSHSQHPEWIGTTIDFALAPASDGTTLAFAQRGYAEAGDCHALCTGGWAHYLASLKAWLETGRGDPHR